MDYYEILSVHLNAETRVIQAAYRALAKAYHPDTFDGDKKESHEKMAQINEAYNVLKDKGKRKIYDKEYSGHVNDTNHDSNDAWATVASYYPELKNYVRFLHSIDHGLSSSFISLLLDTKQYAEARALTLRFLGSYSAQELPKCSGNIMAAYLYCRMCRNVKAANLIKSRIQVLGPRDISEFSAEDKKNIYDSIGITLERNPQLKHRAYVYISPGGIKSTSLTQTLSHAAKESNPGLIPYIDLIANIGKLK